METLKLTITGMHCDHCVASVEGALKHTDGVAGCDVSVGNARVEFDEARTSRSAIIAAVRSAGAFDVSGFSKVEN